MNPSVDVPLRDTHRYWLDHLQACEGSGQSMRAYAESEGIPVKLLYSWKCQLRRRGLWPVAPERSSSCPAPSPQLSFERVEVVGQASASHCRIELPNGVVVNWPVGADSARLAGLVSVLRG